MDPACTTPSCPRPPTDTWGPTHQRYCHACYMRKWREPRAPIPSSRVHLEHIEDSPPAPCSVCGLETRTRHFDCWEPAEGDVMVLKEHLLNDGRWFRVPFLPEDYVPCCGSEECVKELDGPPEEYLYARIRWYEAVLLRLKEGGRHRIPSPPALDPEVLRRGAT